MKTLTPRTAIKEHCLECAGSIYEVKTCPDTMPSCQPPCPFHPHRTGKRPRDHRGRKGPARIIREFCLDCCSGSVDAVRDCPDLKCSCYYYRMGRYPKKADISQSYGLGTGLFTNRRGKTFRLPRSRLKNPKPLDGAEGGG